MVRPRVRPRVRLVIVATGGVREAHGHEGYGVRVTWV